MAADEAADASDDKHLMSSPIKRNDFLSPPPSNGVSFARIRWRMHTTLPNFWPYFPQIIALTPITNKEKFFRESDAKNVRTNERASFLFLLSSSSRLF